MYPLPGVAAFPGPLLEPLSMAQLAHYVKTGVMSSSLRRACYKCGNVGHYAGRSSSPKAPGAFLTSFRGLRLFRASML